jgi:hypothetical protein
MLCKAAVFLAMRNDWLSPRKKMDLKFSSKYESLNNDRQLAVSIRCRICL